MRDTGHFARGVEPRNHLAVLIERLGLRIDADAAHRVVNRRNGLHDVVLALRHIDEAAAVMEVLVVPRPRHRIHAVNRRLEVGVGDFREFRDALQVTAGLHRAGLREDGVFVRMGFDGL